MGSGALSRKCTDRQGKIASDLFFPEKRVDVRFQKKDGLRINWGSLLGQEKSLWIGDMETSWKYVSMEFDFILSVFSLMKMN